jgi:DNA-binding response OmpR family regulator
MFRPMKIMIVEDDPTILGFLESWLLSRRHEVRAYVSSDSAAEILRSWQPELLLCDLGLSGQSGEDLARAATALPRPARVLVMSGERERLEHARPLAEAALLKPFRMDELVKLIERPASDDGRALVLR